MTERTITLLRQLWRNNRRIVTFLIIAPYLLTYLLNNKFVTHRLQVHKERKYVRCTNQYKKEA